MFEQAKERKEEVGKYAEIEKVYEAVGHAPRSFFELITPDQENYYNAPQIISGKPSEKVWVMDNGDEVAVYYNYDSDSGKLIGESWVTGEEEVYFEVSENMDIDGGKYLIRKKYLEQSEEEGSESAESNEQTVSYNQDGSVVSIEFSSEQGDMLYEVEEASLCRYGTVENADQDEGVNPSVGWVEVF